MENWDDLVLPVQDDLFTSNFLFSSREIAVEVANILKTEMKGKSIFELSVRYDGCNSVSFFSFWGKPACLEKYKEDFCRAGARCLWKPAVVLVDPTQEQIERFGSMDRRSLLKAAYSQEMIGVSLYPRKSSIAYINAIEAAERIVNNMSEEEVEGFFARGR